MTVFINNYCLLPRLKPKKRVNSVFYKQNVLLMVPKEQNEYWTADTHSAAGVSAMDDEVRKIFNKFDKNGDGRISSAELKEMLSKLGSKTTSEEVKRMMAELDKNGDGYIDLKEFAEFHHGDADGKGGGTDGEKEVRDAFDLYDLDKNGVISASELHAVMKKLGEKCSLGDCRRMIKSVDADGDGNVNFEEFKKMMTRSSNGSK